MNNILISFVRDLEILNFIYARCIYLMVFTICVHVEEFISTCDHNYYHY